MENNFLNFMKESYNVYVLNKKNNYIIYLNTYQFIISNNYYGLIAIGERHYNYEKQCSEIECHIKNEKVMTNSQIDALIMEYEKVLNTPATHILYKNL